MVNFFHPAQPIVTPATPDVVSSAATMLAQIRPGDVIAFSGSDLPSTVVKVATRSHYVHVAIIFSVTANHQGGHNILLAESHIDTSLPSVGTGKRIHGVQLQWLVERLTMPGPIWWAALKTPLSPTALMAMQSWLSDLEQKRIPYDFVQAVEAGIDGLLPGDRKITTHLDEHALFCSELVTRALQLAGVVDATLNPAEQTPVEVMQFPCFQAPVLIKP
jgi:hypothetical protein